MASHHKQVFNIDIQRFKMHLEIQKSEGKQNNIPHPNLREDGHNTLLAHLRIETIHMYKTITITLKLILVKPPHHHLLLWKCLIMQEEEYENHTIELLMLQAVHTSQDLETLQKLTSQLQQHRPDEPTSPCLLINASRLQLTIPVSFISMSKYWVTVWTPYTANKGSISGLQIRVFVAS